MHAKLAIFRSLALVSLIVVAGCSKNGNDRSRDDYQGVGHALGGDDQGTGVNGQGASRPATAEVPGVDVSKLGDSEKKKFARMLDTLQSPCGKSHSLRKSLLEDESCKRAVFAGRYVALLVGEALDDLSVRAAYDGRYRNDKRPTFDLASAPRMGAPDGRYVIVEFLDYG